MKLPLKSEVASVLRDALIRVAGFLALDPKGMVAEFRDLRIVAERPRKKKNTTCSNASAWATAVHDTQTSPKRRACYNVRNLLPALRRYMVYSVFPPAWNNASPNANSSWGSAELSGSGPSNGSWCCPLPHDMPRNMRKCAARPVGFGQSTLGCHARNARQPP